MTMKRKGKQFNDTQTRFASNGEVDSAENRCQCCLAMVKLPYVQLIGEVVEYERHPSKAEDLPKVNCTSEMPNYYLQML